MQYTPSLNLRSCNGLIILTCSCIVSDARIVFISGYCYSVIHKDLYRTVCGSRLYELLGSNCVIVVIIRDYQGDLKDTKMRILCHRSDVEKVYTKMGTAG